MCVSTKSYQFQIRDVRVAIRVIQTHTHTHTRLYVSSLMKIVAAFNVYGWKYITSQVCLCIHPDYYRYTEINSGCFCLAISCCGANIACDDAEANQPRIHSYNGTNKQTTRFYPRAECKSPKKHYQYIHNMHTWRVASYIQSFVERQQKYRKKNTIK